MGFGACVESDCGKTNATAATIIRKSLAAIPMRTEVHRATAPHPGISSSIGADTETSEAPLLAFIRTTSLIYDYMDSGKDYDNPRKFPDKVVIMNCFCQWIDS